MISHSSALATQKIDKKHAQSEFFKPRECELNDELKEIVEQVEKKREQNRKFALYWEQGFRLQGSSTKSPDIHSLGHPNMQITVNTTWRQTRKEKT